MTSSHSIYCYSCLSNYLCSYRSSYCYVAIIIFFVIVMTSYLTNYCFSCMYKVIIIKVKCIINAITIDIIIVIVIIIIVICIIIFL